MSISMKGSKARHWAAAFGCGALLWASHAAAVTLDTPIISCGASSDVTIEISVCMPEGGVELGAPAGFSVQWMTAAAYAANGNQWLASDDPGLCKASFSGQPCSRRSDGDPLCQNRFSLGPGECTVVEIGNLFDEEVGLSSTCFEALQCGTEYVFRSFAHAYRLKKRSEFTANLSCTTDDCQVPPGCTLTQGFWKTHCGAAYGCNANLGDAWPTLPDTCPDSDAGLTLGTVCYDKAELEAIFNKPAQGNGLVSLAHQLIAAKLNVLSGADDSAVATVIQAADALVGGLVVPPVGTGSLSPGSTSGLTDSLADYNEGEIGPGHCE